MTIDNTALLSRLTTALDAVQGVRVGDFIRFADGVELRVSYVWPDGRIQTTTPGNSYGARFYLGAGFVSYSGGLLPGVYRSTLTETGELKDGACWFFDRGIPRAHAGVDVTIPFRVFVCELASKEAA